MKKDSKGRITNLNVNNSDDGLICTKNNVQKIYGGDSVCVSCGKDMPGCWDTVCSVCGDTSCYNCSYSDDHFWYFKKHTDDHFWYCKKHKPKIITFSILLPKPLQNYFKRL